MLRAAWAVVALALVMAAPQAAQAQTYNYTPSAQVTLVEINGSGSYTQQSGSVAPYHAANGGDQVGYVEFNIPSGATYTTASLVYIYSDYGGPTSGVLTAVLTAPTASAAGVNAVRSGSLYANVSLSQGSYSVPLPASALSRMNTLGSSGGGVFRIGVSGPPSGAYFGELGAVRLTGSGGVAAPTLTARSPAQGPVAGGATVTLTGTNFIAGSTSVTIDGTVIPAGSVTVTSATSLTFTTPAHAAGGVAINVTTPGGTSSTVSYTYLQAPTANALSPNSGPSAGGTVVTVTGTGFSIGGTSVTIDGTVIPAGGVTVSSATTLTFTTPAHAAGVVPVSVTTPGGTSGAVPGGFTYNAAPTISALSPAEGAASATLAPASVTISGSGFAASGNSVTFDGVAATITSESATSITVTPPARAAGGQVNVVVTNAGGTSATAVNAYRYLLPPVVTVTWSPAVISGSQNTTFTLTVTNPNSVGLKTVRVASNGGNLPFYLTQFGGTCGSGTYNANSGFTLSGFDLAANATCTVTSQQSAGGSGGVFQFVTNAPTSIGTTTTNVTLTGTPATSNTITVYQTPTLSVVTPNTGPLAGGQAITITGQNFHGVTGVSIDGVAVTNLTVLSATQITATTPPGASTGPKTVTATNPAGTGSRGGLYQYAAPPAVPTISAPVTGGSTQGRPTYSGVSSGGSAAIVTVYVDGASIGTATPAGNGAWSLQQPTALAAGSHTVYVTATTSTGGTSAASATVNFTVDVTPPATPVVTSPASGQTTLASPTYTGSAEAGATVTVTVDGSIRGTTTATGGAWSLTQPTPLANGSHTITVQATDPAGNSSGASAAQTFIVNTAPPVITALSTNRINIFQTATLTVTGQNFTGATALTIDGAHAQNFVVVNDGTITASVPISGAGKIAQVRVVGLAGTSVDAGTIDDLRYIGRPVVTAVSPAAGSTTGGTQLTLTGVDFINVANVWFAYPSGGGTSQSGTTAFVVDSETQLRVTVPNLGGFLPNGGTAQIYVQSALGEDGPQAGPQDDYLFVAPPRPAGIDETAGPETGGTRVTITGTRLDTVTGVTIGGRPAANVTSTATTVSFDTPIGTGTQPIGLTWTYGTVSTFSFTYAPPPPAPTLVGTPPALSNSRTAEFFASGTGLEISLDGGAFVSMTPQPYAFTGLADGSHTVLIRSNSIGGVGPTASFTWTIDATAPAVPVVTTPAANAITGRRPTISGTAEVGASVGIVIDQALVGTVTATDGTWTFTPTADLADNFHNAFAFALDAAGNNSGLSAARLFRVDATAPTVQFSRPEFTNTQSTPTETFLVRFNEAVSNVTVADFSLTSTGTAVGTISSVAVTGVDVRVSVTGISGTGTLRLDVNSGAGITDAGGNAGVAAFTGGTVRAVDTEAPAFAVLTSPVPGSTTGNRTPTLSGTAEAGATVIVYANNTFVGQAAATGGVWSVTVTTPLADGDVSIQTITADATLNSSGLSPVVTFTVDATAPTTPTITAPVSGATSSDNTPTLSGSAEAGSTVTISIDGTIVGTAMATGGTWSFTTGVLADGPHTVSATATDAAGNVSPGSGTITFLVDATAPSAPVITTPANGSTTADSTPTLSGSAETGSTVTVSIDGGVVGTATAAGGTWSFTTGVLADGPHTVSATATDAAGNVSPVSGTVSFTVDASAPGAPVITIPANGSTTPDNTPLLAGSAEDGATVAISLDGAVVGTVTATGGSWTFTSGPLTDGSHTVSATATDAVGNVSPVSATTTFTVDATAPAAPVITTPADGSVTDDGTPRIAGTAEANANIMLSINGGAPVALVADISGNWGYTPAANLPAGVNILTATATDGVGNVSPVSATVRFTYSPIAISTASLPAGQVGVAYAATITATGGATPYGFAITAGALPDGISLSSTGALSGTPTASGAFAFTVTATDGNNLSASQAYTVTIAAPAAPDADPTDVEITSPTSGPATIDLTSEVSNAASIEIVTPPTQGSVTVDGLSIIYTPQPGFYGTVTFQYRAVGFANGGPGATSAPATVTIVIAAPTLVLPGGALPNGQIATAYSQTLAASGGTAPYTYAVTAGALPTGMSLAADGTLSGSPTAGGAFSFTVTATDSSTGTGPFSIAAVHTLTIDAPALTVTPAAVPSAIVAQAYTASFSASGGVGPYTFAVTGGALPTGLTLSTAGVLSGTPTQGGAFAFTVTATDASTGAGPYSASQAVTLTVAGSAISVTPASLPAASRGTAYSQTVAASGGVAPYRYTIASGALPAGLTLSTAGQISGTPTVVGTFTFQVRATDSAGGSGPYSGVANLTLTVGAASLTVTPATLPDVLAGTGFSQQMQATGGQGGYTFAVSGGTLPTGVTLSSAGLLAGRPTVAGTYAFTVTATDAFGNTGSVGLSLTVTSRPDPSADPDVRGLSTAQAEATRRMAGTQISNFGRRLEALHGGGGGQSPLALNLSLDAHAFTPLDEGQRTMGELSQVLGRGLGGARDLSGREELARMMDAGRVDGVDPAGEQADGRLAAGQGGRAAGPTTGPRIWAGGAISLGERDATTQTADMSISTSGVSAGIDVSVRDNLDVGVGVGFGQEQTDVGADVSRMEADSRVGVAYASWRPAGSVFVDGMLGYGELSFDTRRKTPVNGDVVFGERDGTTWFGSLSTGVDRTVGSTRWIGYGRLEMLSADLDAFTETGSPLWALSYEARTVESFQGALGLRYEREILHGYDRWTPGFRLEWRREFADAGGQTLRYADWLDGPAYLIGQDGWERSQFNLGLSLGFQARSGWSWSGEYEGGFSDGETLGSLRIRVAKSF